MKALQMLDLIASDSAYWGRNLELTPFCDQTLNLLVPVGQRSYLEKFVRDMRVVRCALFMEAKRRNLYFYLATKTVNTIQYYRLMRKLNAHQR